MIQCKILTLSSCEATKGILMKMKKFLADVMQNTRDLFPQMKERGYFGGFERESSRLLVSWFCQLGFTRQPGKTIFIFSVFQSIKTIFHHHIFIQSSIDQFWGSLKLGFKYCYWYFEENNFSSNLWSWPSWLKKESICIPNKVYYRHFLVANTS